MPPATAAQTAALEKTVVLTNGAKGSHSGQERTSESVTHEREPLLGSNAVTVGSAMVSARAASVEGSDSKR